MRNDINNLPLFSEAEITALLSHPDIDGQGHSMIEVLFGYYAVDSNGTQVKKKGLVSKVMQVEAYGNPGAANFPTDVENYDAAGNPVASSRNAFARMHHITPDS